MIAQTKQLCHRPSDEAWHDEFLKLLPTIRTHVRIAFRHLDPEDREEAAAEVVANACRAYVRLVELGKTDTAYAGVLARYGVARVNDGRRVGGRLNVRDVSSEYCQRRKGVAVKRLDKFDKEESALAPVVAWILPFAICGLALVTCCFLLFGLRRATDDEAAISELLVEELTSERPTLLPGPAPHVTIQDHSHTADSEPGSAGQP